MQMLIDGQWVGASEEIPVFDPFSAEVIDVVPKGTAADVDRAVTAALEGYRLNRALPT